MSTEHLGEKLEEYVKTLPVPVIVLRTEKRSGLIRARLLGAKHVKGQVITFLDAHCECTEGWLEPLLARIVQDRKTVVCPIIDVISDETFEYITASDMTWGGFNWKLNFRWYESRIIIFSGSKVPEINSSKICSELSKAIYRIVEL